MQALEDLCEAWQKQDFPLVSGGCPVVWLFACMIHGDRVAECTQSRFLTCQGFSCVADFSSRVQGFSCVGTGFAFCDRD